MGLSPSFNSIKGAGIARFENLPLFQSWVMCLGVEFVSED